MQSTIAENAMQATGEYDVDECSNGDDQAEYGSELEFELFCFMPQNIYTETCTDPATKECEEDQGALTDAPFVFDGASFVKGK